MIPFRLASLGPLLALPAVLGAQAPSPVATRTQPLRCASADSVLGPKAAGSKAHLHATYVPDRDQSILFTQLPVPISTAAGIRGATGLVRLPGRGPLREPLLELSLRVISETERAPGTQWLRLAADDSTIGDSLPLALRRQAALGNRRVLQTATAPLTYAQTVAVAKANRISGGLSGTRFDLTDEERDGMRALVVAAICGTKASW